MKGKMLRLVLSLVSGFAVLIAATTAYASFPWIMYQPKAPKSLIKADE